MFLPDFSGLFGISVASVAFVPLSDLAENPSSNWCRGGAAGRHQSCLLRAVIPEELRWKGEHIYQRA